MAAVTEQDLDTRVKGARKLHEQHENATLKLMEYHWESINTHGLGLREYARGCGRDKKTISGYARGWALWQERTSGGGSAPSPNDVLELAKMSEAKAEATEIIATAKGISVATARKKYEPEVRRIQETIAENVERAVESGMPPVEATTHAKEQASKMAAGYETMRNSRARRSEQHKESKGQVYRDLEYALNKARKAMNEAAKIARRAQVGEDHIELLEDSLGKIKETCDFISMAIKDHDAIDWDNSLSDLLSE